MTRSDAVAVTAPQIHSLNLGTYLDLLLPLGAQGWHCTPSLGQLGPLSEDTCLWLGSAGLLLLVLLAQLL